MRRDKIQQQIALQVGIALTAGMFSIVPVAYGAPVGGTSTTATISYSDVKDANNAVIGQDTKVVGSVQNNVVDWHDFSVAEKEKVVFDGNKNYMNIVTGANTSDIKGKIQGGGEVYIINPHGVLVDKTAEINVGSFYASTREVAVSDAIAAATAANNGTGSLSSVIAKETSTSGAAMDVVNLGKISADKVVLEGENIRLLNSADITAPNGVTVRADEGYIHVGSTNGQGGAGYTSEKLTASGTAATVEQYTLVNSGNWNTMLGTGAAVSGKYMLSENIDASDTTKFGTNNPFKTVTGTFSGKLDGNFYEVSNVSGAAGLFSKTQNATIENLGVTSSRFNSSSEPTGSIVSVANAGTVLNHVYNDGSTVDNSYSPAYAGGLVGEANGVTIKNSYNTGDIENGSGGGLIGYINSGTNQVTESYSTGKSAGIVFTYSLGGSISFENVLGTGSAFYTNNAGSSITAKNSLVISTNAYGYVDANGTIKSVLNSSLDKTALATYTSGVISLGNTDITNTGGLVHSGTKLVRPTWRIYEGKTAPVLTAFQKGIKTTDYKYQYFDSNNNIDAGAAKYNNGANDGEDMTYYTYGSSTLDGLVYNGDTLKIVDSSNAAVSTNSNNELTDASTVFKTATNSTSTVDPSHVFYDDSGQKHATYTPASTNATTGVTTKASQDKIAFIWSDQKGYDLVGNNISIAPRRVVPSASITSQVIVKEYDGSYDATSFVPSLFGGTSGSSTGILPVDSSSVKVGLASSSSSSTLPDAYFCDPSNTAVGNADVGANKRVYINGKVTLLDGSNNTYAGNDYVIIDSTTGKAASTVNYSATLNAAIKQKQLQVAFTSSDPIVKTYDKTADVLDSSGNARSFGQNDFTLSGTIVTGDTVNLTVATTNNAQYIDKSTKQAQVNVGTHDVAIGGVTLTGNSAKNYTLVDASGNTVYSELGVVTGFSQQGIPVGTGTGGGTFYASGKINLRSLGNTGYKWFKTTTNGIPNYETATKEYDNTEAYSEPSTYYVSNYGSTTSSTTPSGMVAGDNLDFQVQSAEFTTSSTNVSSGITSNANTSSTPQGVRYTVKVSGTAASNYTFDSQTDIDNGTAVALTNGGSNTYSVMGEGNITPRTIYITVPQAGTADKYYDGDANVKDASGKTAFDMSSGYLSYADNINTHHLVSGDKSSISITGLYKSGNGYAAKDVNYDTTNNTVLQKDIDYTAQIMQNGQVSTNYVFNTNNKNTATFTGKGTIKQRQLGNISFADVSKTYDGSAALTNSQNSAAPQYKDDKIKIQTPTGLISGENVDDVFYVDSNGYLDSNGIAKLNAGTFTANYGDLASTPSGFTVNANVKRDPQNLSNILARDVEYSGINELLKNHNYALDATTASTNKVYGKGTINPFMVTNKSWITLDRNSTPITKVYDGTDTLANPMSYLNTTGNNKAEAKVTAPSGTLSGLASTVTGARYSSPHSNNDSSQNVIYTVNFLETGNYGIASNLKTANNNRDVELSLVNDGKITRKHIIANTLVDNNITKTYDATKDISRTGDSLIYISNQIESVDQGKVTNGITAAYTDENASLTTGDKTVVYNLVLAGDTDQDYYIDDGNGNATINGAGTINKRDLLISVNKTPTKVFDGLTNVTQMPTAMSDFAFGDPTGDVNTLKRDNFDNNLNLLTGTYGIGSTDATFTGDEHVGTGKDVQYKGFFKALGYGTANDRSGNYTINGVDNSTGEATVYGIGDITPASFNGMFYFRLKSGINQIYNGDNVVGKLESNTSAADIDQNQRSWVDLNASGVDIDGNGTIDRTLANGAYTYTISSAVFSSTTAGEADADAGSNKKVTYTIALTPKALADYGITSSSAVPISNLAATDGVITPRVVTVELTQLAKDGLAKTYDGTGKIYNNNNKAYSTDTSTGTEVTGSTIVEFKPLDMTNHTGLVKGTNNSSGMYTDVNVSGSPNKVIEYQADVSGDKASNYIFKDVNGNTLTNGKGAALTTSNNTINPFGVVLTADPITKVYDSTTDVALLDAQNALKLDSAVNNETVTLQGVTANTGKYTGADVLDANGNPAVHTVHYTGLSVNTSTPTNYILVDSTGTELSKDAAGYKIDGTGTITPFTLTTGNYTINFNAAGKTYDTTQEVWKNNQLTDLTNNYINDHYVTLGNGTQQTLTFSSYFAEYDTPNATGTTNGATRVNYRLGLGGGNYDLTALRNAGLLNSNDELLLSGSGTIDKKTVYAALTNNPADSTIVKPYDGNDSVLQDVANKVAVSGLFTSQDGTTLNIQAINAKYKDKNVARDASGNVTDKDVYYHVELTGSAKDNYKIVGDTGAIYASLTDNTGTLTGRGRIAPKELTVDFKLAERDYNGRAVVNAPDIQLEKFNGLVGNDSIPLTLDATAMALIQGTYGTGDTEAAFQADGNVKRNGDNVGYKSVKYDSIKTAYDDYLTRNLNTDAANYTVKDTTFYKEGDNKGKINPLTVTALKAKWQGVDKVYDATPDVLNPANTMKLVTTATLTGNEIEVTYTGADSGVYVDGNGVAQKDVGNYGLKYDITEVKENLGNYQLDANTANNAKRAWLSTTAADNVNNQAVTGSITPRTLNVIAQNGFHKIYDGTNSIADSEAKDRIGFSAADEAILQKDNDVNYDVSAHYADSAANVAPDVVANGKDVTYTLTLNGNTKGNYILNNAVNDKVTDTDKLGDIEQRKVYVEAVNVNGIDKVYDTTKALPANYSSTGRFALAATDADTGIIAGEEDIQLNLNAIQGSYENAHVQRNADGTLAAQNINFNNFKLQDTNTKNSDSVDNYYVVTDSLTGSGTIKPKSLTVSIKNAPTKVYDGDASLSATYAANSNLDVQGLLSTDSANLLIDSAEYADANAGTGKQYTYSISIGNDDYELVQNTLTANDGTITKRVLTPTAVSSMTKEYDGTTAGTQDALAHVNLANVLSGENAGLTVTAEYDNPHARVADGSGALASHTVTYSLGIANPNYQLSTDTVTGTGTITPKELAVSVIHAPTKVYDGTVSLTDGYATLGNLSVVGLVNGDTADIQLHGADYDSANAGTGKNYTYSLSLGNSDYSFGSGSVRANGLTTALTGSDGVITPRVINASLTGAMIKEYDGTTDAPFNAAGNLRLSNVLAGEDAGLTAAAKYMDANAGTGKDYTYTLSLSNGNYAFADGDMSTISGNDGVITPRVINAVVNGTMTKEYDGTTDGTENALANVSLNRVLSGDTVGLTAVAKYDNPNAGISEDSDELQNHVVTYTLNLTNSNYQLAEDTVTGMGTISRKGLTIVATPEAINTGEEMPKFSGTVEGLTSNDGSLAGLFTFAPESTTTTQLPGSYGVYGWYSNRITGNLGLNYTFAQADSNNTAFTVNYINNADNPDTKITPNNDIYHQISKDMNSGFGDNGAAAIEYVDKSGNVIARESIGSGEIRSSGIESGINAEGLSADDTSLANIGIVGGDIVNLEGADAASTANIEVDGDGSIVNLEVFSIEGEQQKANGQSAMEIVSTDSSRNSDMEIRSTDSDAKAAASIQIVDEKGNLLEENEEDKAEKKEKEGEIAIESSGNQDDDEIELKVENEGVNVA